jgi:predicted phage terminase large subunit-like protein
MTDKDPRPEMANQIARFSAKIKSVWHRLDITLRAKAVAVINQGTQDLHVESCRRDFLYYVKSMWTPIGIPEAYKEGEHHRQMADAFNRIADGSLKRLILAMPPRSGKSTFASVAFPPWYLGRFPGRYVMQISNGTDLAKNFGSKVVDMFSTDEFKEIFPGVKLSKNTKSKSVFNTNKKGRYIARSLGSKVAGEGGHVIILDDPHSEQDVVKMVTNRAIWEDAWQRFLGLRQRSQRGSGGVAIIVIATRWNSKDITGRCLKLMADGKEKWEVIEFPAILDEHTPNERSFWEEGAPLEMLRTERSIQPNWKWNAQYQQKPMDEGANIIRREWWKDWAPKDDAGRPKFPKVHYVIQSWDTAQSSKQMADFSASTTWGLFYASPEDERRKQSSMILLDATQGRWDMPALRDKAVMMSGRWKPDVIIVEEKQSGNALRSLLDELHIDTVGFVPSRGSFKMSNDKMSRLHSVSPIFSEGLVYAPLDEAYAQDVRESCAMAGFGGADDLADTVTMCMKHFREGRYIQLPGELRVMREEEEEAKKRPERTTVGYW